jgi:hypothetical protein
MSLLSQIKVRQISQSELSGFVSGMIPAVLSGTGLQIGGNISPTISNAYSLGSTGLYFSNLYTDQISIPSGSGIYFGNVPFTAYMSGGNGIVSINGLTISTNSSLVGIVGPIGPSGSKGATGIQGNSGISITGYSNYNNLLTFYYSNGTSGSGIQLPSGATGATGAYTTGFFQSGNYLSPTFSNGSTGSSFFIPSGGIGPQGPVGNIYINMQTLTGFASGDVTPQVYIPNLYPTITENPPMNLVRGMAYGIGYSGLDTLTISGTGTNYFVDVYGLTGYLQLVFFNSAATPGRYLSGESLSSYSTIYGLIDSSISTNLTTSNYLNSVSFNTAFTSSNSYYYGFQRYSLSTLSPIDGVTIPGQWGFYILGPVSCNFFGPTGAPGSQGIAGVPGPQGEIGPQGINGSQGVGITGVLTNGTTIQFQFSDGSESQTIVLPSGGPSGAMGLTGPQGPSGLQGIQGPSGNQGFADTYAAQFYPNTMTISGFTGFYKQISGIGSWIQCTGTGVVMQVGDAIWFSDNSLVGKAYTPWQSVIFADNNYYNSRYFYANVITFNNNNGTIQCVVNSSPAPAGLVGGYIQLYNYSIVSVNLGGLGSSGAVGPQGIQGVPGNTGHSIFVGTGFNVGGYSTTNISGNNFDSWNIGIGYPDNTINIISSTISTGQTIIIRVQNSGTYSDYSDGINPLLYWSVDNVGSVKFPNNVPAPGPNPNTTSIYTLVRLLNFTGTNPLIYCTYSVNYPL